MKRLLKRLINWFLFLLLCGPNYAVGSSYGSGGYDNGGYNSGDYDDGYGGRTCKLRVLISLNKRFTTQRGAADHCRWVHDIFQRGCSVRSLGYDRGYGAFFAQDFFFEGRGRDWQASRRSVFDQYFEWSQRFGFGRGFSHQLFYDSCGISY